MYGNLWDKDILNQDNQFHFSTKTFDVTFS